MIHLERHIEALLLSNDCVILPGFGGFTASHVPAQYDGVGGLWLPPRRTLGFNPKLTVNDSLLAQSYAEAYDISYPDALTQIESEISEMRQLIDNEGWYELCDIGTLRLDDGRLEFLPCEAGLLTPSLYGLSTFEIALLAKGTQIASKGAQRQATASSSIAALTAPPIADSEVGDEADDELTDERSKKVPLWCKVAAAVAVVIVCLAVSLPMSRSGELQLSSVDSGLIGRVITDGYNNIKKPILNIVAQTAEKTTDNNGKSANDADNADKTTIAAKNVNDADKRALANKNADNADKTTAAAKDKTAPAATKTASATAKPQSEKVVKSSAPYYCIVLASKVSRVNAEDFINRLSCYEIEARLLELNGVRRVVYGQYATMNDAYCALRLLRGVAGTADAWVFEVSE